MERRERRQLRRLALMAAEADRLQEELLVTRALLVQLRSVPPSTQPEPAMLVQPVQLPEPLQQVLAMEPTVAPEEVPEPAEQEIARLLGLPLPPSSPPSSAS